MSTDSGEAVVTGARAAYVSVTDVPVVVDLTEAVAGQPGSSSWAGVDELVQAGIAPEADIHASSEYRRMLAAELTRRALTRPRPEGPHERHRPEHERPST